MSRRALLGGAGGLALGLGAGACAAPGTGDASSPGAAELRMGWWGNQTRTELTNQVIGAYQDATPGVTVAGEPAEWAGYWDRLATQTAANNAPDVIQMDLKYLRQYADRGALLPLDQAGVGTADFAEGTLDPGRTPDGLMGVNAGVNVMLVAANPAVFEQLGVELPDDETWTWEEWAALSAEITAKGDGIIGSSDPTLYDLGFWMWMRQRGGDLYTQDGLGFDAADAQEFFELSRQWELDGVIPEVGVSSDDIVAPLADRLFTQGRTAMSVYWSNQVLSLETASGADLRLLRFPSMTGRAADAQLFYNVSMMWSVPARSKEPEAAAAFVDFLVNDPRAADVLVAERGMPASTVMRERVEPALSPSDVKAAAYLERVEPDLTPPSPAPPAGLGDISLPQTRYLQDVRFGRSDPATAAQAYVAELTSMIVR
ncbi:ABC transporter substrate-binding protein [Auraticoccus monumenti]|nr:extracellular solute-binding protein [Auraticoccus monumenti]